MPFIMELKNIKKKYGKSLVLNDISLSLEKGKIYGLLGVNGAGKTTMLRVITGLIPSYSGTIMFKNERLTEGRKKIGSTIENPILFESLTAMGNLKMYNSVYQMPNEELDFLLMAVGLENSKKTVKTFSLGMKQKLALAVALLGTPELIILDEPTNGLDPIAIKELRNLILKLNHQKEKSFLISSHDVNELIKIADRLLIMQSGKIKYNMDTKELIMASQNNHLELEDYIINLMEKMDG